VSATVIIPARFASARFPGKVLASDTGRPLVQHVVDRLAHCRRVGRVIVAADDARIVSALAQYGTEARLTRPDHPSGTDRVAEVAAGLEDPYVVNVQGDEPEIDPETVDRVIERLEQGLDDVTTAAAEVSPGTPTDDPNVVKVVVGLDGRALYFSRCSIPYDRDRIGARRYHHIGIYGYRRAFLLKLAALEPTPLEQAERLEQLRVLEHGGRIGVVIVRAARGGVDTPEQYREFVNRLREATTGAT
jgi:3-deoxy-manno-octulosonate cytidylyltransferase (CMP-KDO synthetase)